MASGYPRHPSHAKPAAPMLRSPYQRVPSYLTSPAISILRPPYQGSQSHPSSPVASVLHPAYHSPPSHPASPANPFLHPGFQLTQTQQCHTTSFQMIHPDAAAVLQRIEAQSSVDVESYVRALGDKRYAIVKESRRAVLLRRARTDSEDTELDDATIRRITNLASAEASRAKKEFIMDELHSQLKKKSSDAVMLATELRKLIALTEQMGSANHQLEVQLQQQRLGYNNLVPTPTQLNDQTLNAAAAMQGNAPRFSAKDNNIPPPTEQFFPKTSDATEDDDVHPSDYSSVMDEDSCQDGCPTTPATVVTTSTDCGLTPEQCRAGEAFQAFELDDNLEMESILCPPNMDSSIEVAEAKLNVMHSSLSSLQREITESLEFSVSNPSDQFTVAG